MPDRPAWIRSVLSLLLVVGVGAVVLAGGGWLAVNLLPDAAEEAADDADLIAEDYDEVGDVSLVETGVAAPGDAMAQVDRCEVVDGVIEAAGRVRNTSGGPQAFLLQLAVVVDGRLLDGTTIEVPVVTMIDGADRDWVVAVGAIDPDAPPEDPPVCEVERIALATELTD